MGVQRLPRAAIKRHDGGLKPQNFSLSRAEADVPLRPRRGVGSGPRLLRRGRSAPPPLGFSPACVCLGFSSCKDAGPWVGVGPSLIQEDRSRT